MLLGFLYLLALSAVAADTRPCSDYLSDETFLGLHILDKSDGSITYYPGGSKRPSDQKISMDGWTSMTAVRKELEVALKIPPREPYQNDWAIFDQQGRRLDELEDFLGVSCAFVLEIGQWMWPAVRIGFVHIAEGVDGDDAKKLETLSLRPVVFKVSDFIRLDECDEIKRLGEKEGLVASKGMMQSHDLEKNTDDASFRTSKQAWLTNYHGEVVARLDERTANLTRVPNDHNEPVQVLRYDESNYYHGHMDWAELELYGDQEDEWRSSHFGHFERMATVFWYLNDVEKGGETIFLKHGQPVCPTYEQRTCPGAPDPPMHLCTKGLKVPPRRGAVILWYHHHPSGRGDRNALHAGCPVGKGLVKWSGNKWVRTKSLDTPPADWIGDHPAIKRMRWRGRTPRDCRVTFKNAHEGAVDVVEVQHSGDRRVHALSPRKSYSFVARRGAKYKVQRRDAAESAATDVVTVSCDQRGDTFLLTKTFRFGRPTKKSRTRAASAEL